MAAHALPLCSPILGRSLRSDQAAPKSRSSMGSCSWRHMSSSKATVLGTLASDLIFLNFNANKVSNVIPAGQTASQVGGKRK